MLNLIVQIIGSITCVVLSYKVFNFISLYFLHETALPRYLHPGKNSYALITGATAGIGLATAKELKRRGFNIILHGRNPKKLAVLSKQMNEEFPDKKTITIEADAADSGASVEIIGKAVEKLEQSGGRLTILINNVGGAGIFAKATYMPLIDMSMEEAREDLDVNARFPTLLTRRLLPILIKNKPGLVINLGSYAGLWGFPFLPIYSPSKAFNHTFSNALALEHKSMKLDVEVIGIVIGQVLSQGNPHETPGFMALSSQQMAQDIIDRIGCGKGVVVGNWRQCLTGGVMNWFPEPIAHAILTNQILQRKAFEEKQH